MTEQEAYRLVLAAMASEMQKEPNGFSAYLDVSNFQGKVYFKWVASTPTPYDQGGSGYVFGRSWSLDDIKDWETITHRLREVIAELKAKNAL